MHISPLVNYYKEKFSKFDNYHCKVFEEHLLLNLFDKTIKKKIYNKCRVDEYIDWIPPQNCQSRKNKDIFKILKRSFLHLFFMPYYYHWWICTTSKQFTVVLIVSYILQIFAFFLYKTEQYFQHSRHLPACLFVTHIYVSIIITIFHEYLIVHTNPLRKKQKLFPYSFYTAKPKKKQSNTNFQECKCNSKLENQKEILKKCLSTEDIRISLIDFKTINLNNQLSEWDDRINLGSTTEADESQEQKQKSETISNVSEIIRQKNKITCIVWRHYDSFKTEFSVVHIYKYIKERIKAIPFSMNFVMLAVVFSVMNTFLPILIYMYRILEFENFNMIIRRCTILAICAYNRLITYILTFVILQLSEHEFNKRLFYVKHFFYLTSCNRSRKYCLPFIRLLSVRNIKGWFILRSLIKKKCTSSIIGTIVSSTFILTILIIGIMCVDLLRDAGSFTSYIVNWELLCWSFSLSIFLLKFMTLGNRINNKLKNYSILITEQINLYLRIDQKPHKKEKLMLSNNILKLSVTLLKELDRPFEISGLSANNFLYTITKVVLLSAFSAVFSELLGFKLKLHKIKIP